MKSLDLLTPPRKGLGAVNRRLMSVASDHLVDLSPLAPGAAGAAIPWLVRPLVEGVDVAGWASERRELVAGWLRAHRALLFRGFGIRTVVAFHALVKATSGGELLQYKDRSTPRPEVGQGVYVSTVYPAAQSINMHNEGTYWRRFPRKLYFCALRVAAQGGETPIADVRRVLARLDPEVRERFRALGVLYVRNYNDGFGLPWQEVFQTTSRAEVEAYCGDNAIELEWKENGRLRTRQARPAVRRHPDTGEEVWFNHGAFFHVSSLEPAIREPLLADFGEEGLPYNTYYGDGTPIPVEVVEQIQAAYRDQRVIFPWQEGDVLLLDNLTVAHGRQPYSGERQVVVAMTEPCGDD